VQEELQSDAKRDVTFEEVAMEIRMSKITKIRVKVIDDVTVTKSSVRVQIALEFSFDWSRSWSKRRHILNDVF
jgi:hypothetical protein